MLPESLGEGSGGISRTSASLRTRAHQPLTAATAPAAAPLQQPISLATAVVPLWAYGSQSRNFCYLQRGRSIYRSETPSIAADQVRLVGVTTSLRIPFDKHRHE
jgi:hypothetical protein